MDKISTPGKTDETKANPFAAFASASGGPLLFGGLGGGSGSTPAFSFSASTFGAPAAPSSAKKEDDEDGEDGEDDGGDDEGAAADESHAADFKPLVQLDKVEVKSGEDNEDVLFKSRAKLYVFVKEDVYGGEVRQNWWREKGLGDAKILKDRSTGECRFLMRQEKTLKICANHKIDPKTVAKEQAGSGGKQFAFPAIDFAEGEGKAFTFLIKFGQEDTGKEFASAFEAAKTSNQKLLDSKGGAVAASPAKPTPAAASVPAAAPVAPVAAPAAPAAASKSEPKPASVESVAKEVSNLSVGGGDSVRVGGFGKCDENDPQVQAAVKFAVEKINKGTLVKLASVKAQVVAGMNYRMALHIRDSAGVVKAHVATVYQPLPHTGQPLQLSEARETGVVS